MSTLRLGTRGSALARWQTEHAIACLAERNAGIGAEMRILKTRGDVDRSTPLPAIGGSGLFTEELERALRDGEIDAAVHSLKDLPIESPTGLVVGAVFGRRNPGDVLVSRNGETLAGLPQGAVVGTSSMRRRAQLLAVRPDIVVRPIRGNVETRIGKVDSGEYDAAVLAAAGLDRLSLSSRVAEQLDLEIFLPAPGQGALAVQCRADDENVRTLLATIDDARLRAATEAERGFLAGLGGGCSLPVAALAEPTGDDLLLRGFVGAVTGEKAIRLSTRGPLDDGTALGRHLAVRAVEEGAAELLP